MIIDDKSPLLFAAVRLWDNHDTPITEFVWFNPSTKVASVSAGNQPHYTYAGGNAMVCCNRVEIGRFGFVAASGLELEALRNELPEKLHEMIILS